MFVITSYDHSGPNPQAKLLKRIIRSPEGEEEEGVAKLYQSRKIHDESLKKTVMRSIQNNCLESEGGYKERHKNETKKGRKEKCKNGCAIWPEI